VQGPGHCTACHTPKSFLGGDKTSDSLRGFNLQGWFAPDITGDASQGLGQWSEADISSYLKTGHNRISAATGPMAEEIINSTSQYEDDDLHAIATYLKSLPGQQSAAPALADQSAMKAGEARAGVGGYPASFGGDYAEGGGDCHLVEHRVMTRHHGWRIRRVQVCS